MRRHPLAALGLLVILVSGTLAATMATTPAADEETIQGIITDWSDSDRKLQVKKPDGQQVAISWDGATQMHGTARVGQQVTVTARKEGGHWIATRIVVGDAKGPRG